jgi:hypothetical protein
MPIEQVEGEESGPPLTPDGLPPKSDSGTLTGTPFGGAATFGGSSSAVSGTESLSLEVTVLSLEAVDKVADEISRLIEPVAKDAKLGGVVIADPEAIANLRLHAALSGHLDALEARVANAAKAPEAGEEGMEGGFVDLAAAGAAAEGVKGIAHSVGNALSVFEVSSTYSGKSGTVGTSALHAALAKHIAARGFESQVPRYSVMPGAGRGFVERALDLQRQVQPMVTAGTSTPEIDAVNSVIDALLQRLFEGSSAGGGLPASGGRLAERLAEADMIQNALDAGFGLLTVELAASGGSYRTRKWILNALFGRDGLTYSGGAAATFFLLAGNRMSALASDTIYFASGQGTFGRRPNLFSPTNIKGL